MNETFIHVEISYKTFDELGTMYENFAGALIDLEGYVQKRLKRHNFDFAEVSFPATEEIITIIERV